MDNRVKLGIAAAIVIGVIITSIPSLGISFGGSGGSGWSESNVLRIGYFPNVNHAQAVIGLGNGDFQDALDGIEVRTQIFNAGPSVIEALRANAIDVAYVGPNPAINGYVVTDGEGL